ncbi:hypothetical protein QOT17_013907 [Balamuthia mandrillaris]
MRRAALMSRLVSRLPSIGKNGGRFYKVEGVEQSFPSVTTVLSVINKPQLMQWTKEMALQSVRLSILESPLPSFGGAAQETVLKQWVSKIIKKASLDPGKIGEEAASFGTRSHVLIEQLLLDQKPDIPDNLQTVVKSFRVYQKSAPFRIMETEKMVYSLRHGYAGALDALALTPPEQPSDPPEGRLVAMDWKTSNATYAEYALQVAAYAKAHEEMTGQKVEEGWIIRLDKHRPRFEARRVKDLDACFQVFLSALEVWKFVNGSSPFVDMEEEPKELKARTRTRTKKQEKREEEEEE